MKKVNRYERRAAIKRLKQEKPFDTSLTITTEETVAALFLLLTIGIHFDMHQRGVIKGENCVSAIKKEYKPLTFLNPLS